MIRQRAIQAADKHERHDAILAAAHRLLASDPFRLASMADVADESGLAKGTVYLYFPSKEELYLALHERNVDEFFQAVIAHVETAAAVTIEEMLALIRRHLVEPPLFLPLAARCFGLMAHSVSPEAAAAFKERMAARLTRAGAGLERHFPQLAAGAGVALLRHSYALIIGLWQMSVGTCATATSASAPPVAGGAHERQYAQDLERALRATWRGTLGPANARGRIGTSLQSS